MLAHVSVATVAYYTGVKAQAKRAHYTIRGVPREVDRALRAKAVRLGKSLNQVIVDELTRATLGRAKHADFSDLVGRWISDPAFDEIIASQRE